MRYKARMRTRERAPKLEATAKGMKIICPFCTPPHILMPGQDSPCGTTIKVMAIQSYLPSTTTLVQDIHCLKCGKSGGQMVKYRDGYVHMQDCSPGLKLMPEVPKLSMLARVIYAMPEKVRGGIEKMIKRQAKCLEEIDVSGKRTGKVLGYFFWKGEQWPEYPK